MIRTMYSNIPCIKSNVQGRQNIDLRTTMACQHFQYQIEGSWNIKLMTKKKKKKKGLQTLASILHLNAGTDTRSPLCLFFLIRRCQMHINSINFVICLHEKTKQTNKQTKKDKKKKQKEINLFCDDIFGRKNYLWPYFSSSRPYRAFIACTWVCNDQVTVLLYSAMNIDHVYLFNLLEEGNWGLAGRKVDPVSIPRKM